MKKGCLFALTAVTSLAMLLVLPSCTSTGGEGSASSDGGYFAPAPSTTVDQTSQLRSGINNATRSTVR